MLMKLKVQIFLMKMLNQSLINIFSYMAEYLGYKLHNILVIGYMIISFQEKKTPKCVNIYVK